MLFALTAPPAPCPLHPPSPAAFAPHVANAAADTAAHATVLLSCSVRALCAHVAGNIRVKLPRPAAPGAPAPVPLRQQVMNNWLPPLDGFKHGDGSPMTCAHTRRSPRRIAYILYKDAPRAHDAGQFIACVSAGLRCLLPLRSYEKVYDLKGTADDKTMLDVSPPHWGPSSASTLENATLHA